MVALEVLEKMQRRGLVAEEAVYRSLMSACGRCGNSEKGMAVVEMMMSTGIMPDAMVSRCLVDAFAMDESFGDAHPFSLLDWSKFESKSSHRRFMKTLTKNERGRSLSPPRFKGQRRQADNASSTPSNPSDATTTTTIIAAVMDQPRGEGGHPAAAAAGISIVNRGKMAGGKGSESVTEAERGGRWGINGNSDEGVAPVNRRGSFAFELTAGAVTGNRDGHGGKGSSFLGGAGERWSPEDAKHSPSPQHGDEKSAATSLPTGSAREMMQQQVILGERMLERLYPDLEINTEGETCPSCRAALSSREIQGGWEPDPNDYTTCCPRPQASSSGDTSNHPGNVSHDSRDTSAGGGRSGSVTGLWKPGGNGEGAGIGGRGGREEACARRFVPRFSVLCSDPEWEGSTGKGTPLWCEYLSPWVLRKEVHTILAAYGVDFLCSPSFHRGRTNAAGAGASDAGGPHSNPRPTPNHPSDANPTIFWNLVVHFRQHFLPFAFLLAGPSIGAVNVPALFL
ncbi:unnamed protein product [Discosporangium mesarthrocarpum]